MTGKVLNLFAESVAECVHVPPQEKQCSSSCWGRTVKCTHHGKFTGDTNWNKQKWCYCQSKNFSGTSDTVRYLKTCRIISSKMPVLLIPVLICQWYTICLEIYSEKYFNIFFHEEMFFHIFVTKRDTQQFLEK